MPRYKLTIEYDGTPYSGWQRQNDVPSVQQALEEAFFAFCQEEVAVTGSGRTDTGVHARGQVAHVDLADEYDTFKIMMAVNHHLYEKHESVCITKAEKATDDFHARFDTTYREYRYIIENRRPPVILDKNRAWHVPVDLDIEAMREAATYLIGHHDFTSFRASECQAQSPVKTLDHIDIEANGSTITITVGAKSFLHHMVRNIVGSLKMVGEGKWQPDDMRKVLDAKDRKIAGPTAPAHGLYFIQVKY